MKLRVTTNLNVLHWVCYVLCLLCFYLTIGCWCHCFVFVVVIQLGPVLTSPIGSSGLVVSEDDGTQSAVLSVCINSTIKPAPSSANSVVWSTEASGGMSVFSRVQTSLSSSSNGCYWSNLTVNISSVSGAAGHYTVKVSTGAGSATKRFRLEISGT